MGVTEAYGVRHQGYYHPVVATIAVVMFGGIFRYDDASRLLWANIHFEADGSAFEITLDKHKDAQFRQGNKVLATSFPFQRYAVCG